MNAFTPYIKAVGRGQKLKRDLTYDESIHAMRLIVNREATDAQIGAFLIAQRIKGEAVDEIRGFTDVLRSEFVQPITPTVKGLLDLAIPYDGKARTAQLAPAIAIVLAEAGVPVVLHGDEGVPTKEGVTAGAILTELGAPTALTPTAATAMIDTVGFGYLGAAQFAPAYHALLPIRRQFGLRTAFNTVEKLLNPANAAYQISSFFHVNYVQRIRSAQTGVVASWIAQGEEGSIEMAAGRRTTVYATNPDDDFTFDPADVGLPLRERVNLPPDLQQHAALNTAVLANQEQTAVSQVAFTVGAILFLLGNAPTAADGFEIGQRVIASGAAQRRLEKIRKYKGR